ncbi:hypothetical protein, partial [Gemmobacter lanyuensis]|uniref:hypothetical protein n=1 Tax=Gemmobacter lanyuensis TaxID=1054497 RepID=UPI001E33290A
FIGRTEIAGFRPKSYKTLQAIARKTTLFHREINDMSVVQGELPRTKRVGQTLEMACQPLAP